MSERYPDPLEGYKPQRKKQKRETRPKARSPRSPQQLHDLINVGDGSLEDGAKDIKNISDSEVRSSSEPATAAQPIWHVQRLSTFDPSRSKVLNETETEWTVRLHPNDVSFLACS